MRFGLSKREREKEKKPDKCCEVKNHVKITEWHLSVKNSQKNIHYTEMSPMWNVECAVNVPLTTSITTNRK